MNMNSVRSEGLGDTIALFVMTIVAIFFWYMNDLALNWIAIIAGIGAGVVLFATYEWVDRHPVAGFLITMLFIVVLLAAVMTEAFVSGVVATLAVTTALKVYEVYL